MEKTISNEKPAILHDLGDGSFHYNYNIEEVQRENENGENETVFKYDTVHWWGNGKPTENALISAVIRTKYSIDDEFAIQRQRESKPERFKEYYC